MKQKRLRLIQPNRQESLEGGSDEEREPFICNNLCDPVDQPSVDSGRGGLGAFEAESLLFNQAAGRHNPHGNVAGVRGF